MFFDLLPLSKYNVQQVVCESSGGYQARMVRALDNANYKVWVTDPNRIKSFIRSEGVRVKTDKHDAKMIAMFSSQKVCRYEPYKPSEEQVRLQSLTNRRNDLVQMVSNEKKRLQQEELEYCKEDIQVHIDFMKEQIETIENEARQLVKGNTELSKKAAIMQSAPGIGEVTAHVLLAHMPELGTIENKCAAALFGVAPYTQQSGIYKGKASIGGGRKTPRNAIYMSALSIVSRSNGSLRNFYEHLTKKGKPPKVAMVAVMRKLAVILNAMLRKEENWIEKTL